MSPKTNITLDSCLTLLMLLPLCLYSHSLSLSLFKTIHNDNVSEGDADANVVGADDNDGNVDKQSICTESFV